MARSGEAADSDRIGPGVQSVERAFRLFEALVSHRELRLGALADMVGVHKSTAFRLLQTLMTMGYVEKDAALGSYRLGLKAIEMGARAMRTWPIQSAAQPIMDQLAENQGETVNLALVDGTEMVYVMTVDARSVLRMQLDVGRRAPAYCTAVGKAVLAFRPDIEAMLAGEKRIRFTPRTMTELPVLRRDLEAIRQRSYAIDDEEQEMGARCVAAPVRDRSGEVIGALGISAPSTRLSPERVSEAGLAIVEAAKKISGRLGYYESA